MEYQTLTPNTTLQSLAKTTVTNMTKLPNMTPLPNSTPISTPTSMGKKAKVPGTPDTTNTLTSKDTQPPVPTPPVTTPTTPTTPNSGTYNPQNNQGGTTAPQGYTNPNAGYFNSSPATQPVTPTDTSRQGLLQSLVQTGQQGSPNAQTAQQGLIGTAQNNPGNSGRAYDDYQQAINNQNALRSGIAQRYGNIENTAIPLEFQQGREQVLARQYASQLDAAQQAVNEKQQAISQQIQGTQTQQSGYSQAGNMAQTGQGLTQSAINSAIGYQQPIDQFGVKIDPLTGQPISGGSFGDIAAQGGKISGTQSSADNLQRQIQSVQSQASAADANFSILNDYAKGFASNVPFTNGLRQLYGTTAQGDNAVAGFLAKLQDVRFAYHSITGGDATSAIPDNITPSQLQQVQQSLNSTATNNVTGYTKQLNSLTNSGGGSSSGSNSGSLPGGSKYAFQNGKYIIIK